MNLWLHMYVCCCEPSLDMYAQLTVLSFVIFCCIRMHMWTLHSCTAGYMYYWIYVCWSWSCTAGYIYICWIYVLLDRCTTVYMLLLLPETSTKKCYMAYKPCTPAIWHPAYKPYSCGELISRVAQHLTPGL